MTPCIQTLGFRLWQKSITGDSRVSLKQILIALQDICQPLIFLQTDMFDALRLETCCKQTHHMLSRGKYHCGFHSFFHASIFANLMVVNLVYSFKYKIKDKK